MKCPCCGHPLNVGFDLNENRFIAWCGHGHCKSAKANNGEFGRTEEHAQTELIKKLEAKPDWKEE
jgi:hypothetical protein